MARKIVIDVEARFKDEVTDEAKAASDSVDKLNKKKAEPKVDADSSRFIKKMRAAEERAKAFGKKTASTVIDAKDKASAVFGKAMAKAKAYAGKTWSSIVTAKDKASSILSKVLGVGKSIAGKTWSAIVKVKDYAMTPLTKIKNMLFSIKTLAAAVFAGFAAKQLVMNPISKADAYSSAKIGFQTLLGEKQGQQMMNDLDMFAKATPFGTSEVIAQSQKMLAMGWNANDIIPDMQTIGDAAAATGKGEEGLQRIVLALSQIKSKGKLSTEELNQLAEAGISAKRYLAEGLGYGTGDAGLAAMTKDLERGAIGADTAVQALLEGMKEYNGMMEKTANETVDGLWSQIKDTFEINIVRRWGQGLQDGAKRGLGSIVDLLGTADKALGDFGDTIYEVGKSLSNWAADKLEKAVKTIKEVTNTGAFKNASLGGKVKILWDEVIADPLDKWWNTTGKAKVAGIAGSVGKTIGTGITGGLLVLLGFDAESALADGVSIGGSFMEGFLEGFDTDKIGEALSNWVSENKGLATALGAVLGFKLISGIGNLVGNIKNLFPGKSGGTGGLGGSEYATATMEVKAGVVNVYGLKTNQASDVVDTAKDVYLGYKAAKVADTVADGTKLLKAGDTVADGTKLLGTADDAIDMAQLFGTASKAKNVYTYTNAAGDVVGTTSKAGSIFGKAGGAFAKAFPKLSKGLSKAAPFLSVLDFAVDGIFGYAKAKSEGDSTGKAAGKGVLKSLVGDYEAEGAGGRIWSATSNTLKGAGLGLTVGGPIGAAIGAAIGLVTNVGAQILNLDAVKEFFKETLPEAWNNLWDNVGGFFAETVPAAWDTLTSKVSTFFTETVPEAWNSFWESVGNFFTETVPYALGYATGKVWTFFSETVPEAWNSFWDAVGTFFTETVPGWADTIWNGYVVPFFTETLPAAWDSFWAAIGTFFTETLPTWAETTWNDKIVPFFTESIPQFVAQLWENIKTFFTESLPTWAETTWSEKIVPFFTESIPQWFSNLWDNIKTLFNEAVDGFVENIWTPIKTFFTETIPGWVSSVWDKVTGWFNDIKDNFLSGFEAGSGGGGKKARGGIVGGGSSSLEAFAHGGIAKGSTRFIRVNEEAPEMIIPLSSQRRDRALKLWAKTGQLLDVPGFARGGRTYGGNDEGFRFRRYDSEEPTSGGRSIVIEVGGINIEIVVQGNDKESIVEQIKQQAKEIAEVVAGEIADALGGQFENTPVRGGVA